ncbi:angiopoietin-related protein 2 [Latimeria chalumnae]|uniref:Angiopoietin like 6 n=1 Tax=Latimeria chalumnae TaxID=7897 RepID=H2ZWP8_LATCH|nr:PREDICTED: angiopoietin-related protein 6 [Latimeria chalumnae]XP_005991838.1 PREDICTED: angiopoietin-related protein 6 [Latimeria chalumnae]|eukprot:XP_005991837.1 PREDICTED: angiopoietin-related protein 6 [Latimeria chalumnae]
MCRRLDTLAIATLLVFSGLDFLESNKQQEDSTGAEAANEPAVNRNIRSTGPHSAGKCSYTFIVPQQRLTGAICLNMKSPENGGVNKSELQELKDEVIKQQRQIEQLKELVEVDGSIMNEVRFLRKESRNMNSRVTQLYTQLLHEIIQKKDNSLEVSQLENKILNTTAEVLKVATRYRDLEQKYGALASLINNQSFIIAQLERQCQPNTKVHTQNQQSLAQPPLVHVVPIRNFNRSRNHAVLSSNDIQRYHVVQKDQAHQSISVPPSQDGKRQIQQPVSLPPSPQTHHLTQTTTPIPASTKSPGPWRDCLHALQEGKTVNEIYLIKPQNVNKMMQVWCEQHYKNGGWTVIQRRQDGSVNFFRNWEHYKQGFGNIDGEYWLGLENIYWLTNQADYQLLIQMEDWYGRQVFAEYDSFRIEPESDYYRLHIGHYQGNAGDSLSWHDNKQFTTLDRDRDAHGGNCAHYQKGGWWYHMCAHSNLNGVWYRGGHYRSHYQDGVYWAEFRGGSYSLKRVTMMIRPNQ